ncbi:MAG: hypothetical protein J1F38_10175 [Muribaculaceae bacterium]|nr:hypothetical protein [Muribaculaceae bacterium]
MKKIFYIFALLIFAGCSNDKFADTPENYESDVVKTISIVTHQPKTANNDFSSYADNGDDLIAEPIILNGFDDNSLLYISQMGPSESTNPNFSDFSSDAVPYCYIYQYSENENANWDYEYNFELPEDLTIEGIDGVSGPRKAIDWRTIRNIGSVGNAFSLYAFHFPLDNIVRWNVEADQTGDTDPFDKSNFIKSDILGAYHASSALNTRLRFNLFHLMVYLKVTIYVPVYKDNTDNTADFRYSGYNAGSFKGAYVMNASTDFSIEWRTNRSSDTDPPLVQPNTSKKQNIKMYVHKYDDAEIITLENIRSNYYPSYNGDDTDEVRVYNFSVLFPNQTFNGNFLCFALQDAEGNMRYYYFAGNQITGDSGNYSLTQGTFQELKLYLPRATNQTILVGANVLPWSDALTDMTVSQPEQGYGE